MQGRVQMLVGPDPPGLLGNLLMAGCPCWVLTRRAALRFILWKERPLWPPVSAGMGRKLRGRETGLP